MRSLTKKNTIKLSTSKTLKISLSTTPKQFKLAKSTQKMQEYCPQTQNHNNKKAMKILRKSIHAFLTYLHHFTSTPTLLALPFSLSLLLHLHSSAASSALHGRLHAAIAAAGFPIELPTSNFLLLKLSQTLYSSFSTLPLSFFLLLSKSSTIHSLKYLENRSVNRHSFEQNPYTSSFFNLLLTHIYNLFLLVAANSASFTLLCVAFAFTATDLSPTWVFVIGSVFYSFIVANTVVVCNLALISSVSEGKGGFPAILKACGTVNGNTVNALVLALPAKLAMTGVEVVFWYRISASAGGERWIWAAAAEVVLIGYMYSVLIVWDTIIGCLFYQSCKEEPMKEEYACDLDKLRALEEGF